MLIKLHCDISGVAMVYCAFPPTYLWFYLMTCSNVKATVSDGKLTLIQRLLHRKLVLRLIFVMFLLTVIRSSLEFYSTNQKGIITNAMYETKGKNGQNQGHFDMYFSMKGKYDLHPDPGEESRDACDLQTPFIPHIMHQIWQTADVPRVFLPWMRSLPKLHPEWEYWFWTTKEAELFIKLFHPQFMEIYRAQSGLFKADILRFLIMYTFGGVYADLDLHFLKAIDPWTYRTHCFLSAETFEHSYVVYRLSRPLAMITILACRPKHPFYKLLLQWLLHYNSTKDKIRFIDYVYAEYSNSTYLNSANAIPMSSKMHEDSLVLVNPNYFLPTPDLNRRTRISITCSYWTKTAEQRYVCEDRERTTLPNATNGRHREQPKPYSYSNHYWFHSNTKSTASLTNKTFIIDSLFPNRCNVTKALRALYENRKNKVNLWSLRMYVWHAIPTVIHFKDHKKDHVYPPLLLSTAMKCIYITTN